MCQGASKQSSDIKNNTAPGPCPTVLKFLDPPLEVVWIATLVYDHVHVFVMKDIIVFIMYEICII